ncbi:MAG: beta-agarase [Lentimonas sp.]
MPTHIFPKSTLIALLVSSLLCLHAEEVASITVHPETTRAVKGHSELERERYFAIADDGRNFEERVGPEIYDYLINELGVNFGRLLGPVQAAVEWDHAVIEDKDRPGYADIEHLKNVYSKKVGPTEEGKLFETFGPNLNVAAHGNHNVFPKFMGEHWEAEAKHGGHAEYLPENIDAAAELSAAVLKYGFNDFTRPAYYEPLNEPFWPYHKGQHLADWHVTTKEAVQKLCPDVKVGGYCNSVSYFFQDEYRVWDSFETFMRNTEGKLDFYSFHSYDYFRLENGEITGRMQGGLPLEGTFDMVAAAAWKHFGEEKAVVVSEHGGYPKDEPPGPVRGQSASREIAAKFFPRETFEGTDFEWDMKCRSIVEFVHVGSIINNTMTFMDHPHVMEKAVPFILLNAFSWRPTYYAVLYVPKDFTDQSTWVPTKMVNFYKFFKGVQGRRVQFTCTDPDLQTQAFVDGDTLYLVINNLSSQPETIRLNGIEGETVSIRRHGRNPDFTPYLTEAPLKDRTQLTLNGREAAVIIAKQAAPIPETATVNEIPFYSDQMVQKGIGGEAIKFSVNGLSVDDDIEYAKLRVSIAQELNKAEDVRIFLNGHELEVPQEDSAERYWDYSEKRGSDFATLKLIPIDPKLLMTDNEVTVIFAEGQRGAVGSAVLRAGFRKHP